MSAKLPGQAPDGHTLQPRQSGLIALFFPFPSELEAFLAGLLAASAGQSEEAGQSGDARPIPSLKTLSSRLSLSEASLGGFRSWTLASRPGWRLIVTGQGKVETALACQTACLALNPSAFLLLGSATALDPALRPGDLVLADPGLEIDFGPDAPSPRFAACRPYLQPSAAIGPGPTADIPAATSRNPSIMPPGRFSAGPVLSMDRNVFDPVEKQALFATHHALAAAWEGAGFHRFLRRNQARGWELRLITESASEPRLPLATLQARMAQGFPAILPILETLEQAQGGN